MAEQLMPDWWDDDLQRYLDLGGDGSLNGDEAVCEANGLQHNLSPGAEHPWMFLDGDHLSPSAVQGRGYNQSEPNGMPQDPADLGGASNTHNEHLCDQTSTESTSAFQLSDYSVCFGVVPSVPVQVRWGLQSLRPDTWMRDGHSYIPLELFLRRKYGQLNLPHGRPLGVLGHHAFQALSGVQGYKSLDVRVLLPENEWEEAMTRPRTAGSKGKKEKVFTMSAELIISGSRLLGDDLGRSLSRQNLFLQSPLPNAARLPYENPQSVSFQVPEDFMMLQDSDAAMDQALKSRGIVDEANALSSLETSDPSHPSNTVIDFDQFFAQAPVLDSQTSGTRLRSDALLSRGGTMLSSLFSHQKQGLTFMLRREAEETEGSNSLWVAIAQSNGEQVYQYSITGAKSPSPSDCLGGILADDMGLGKTLTALATIAATQHDAAAFAKGAPSEARRNTNSQATIVVVPSELLLNTWMDEIKQHFYPGHLRCLAYHGQGRRAFDARLGQYHIVLTTYGTVMAEARRHNGVLHGTEWYRIILDEAHTIRNCSTKQFRALSSVHAHIRWCLTGTPIQNSLEDLGSLITFLGMPLFSEPATFRKFVAIAKPSKRGSADVNFENLRRILSSICLRQKGDIVPGKGYVTEFKRSELSEMERGEYRTLVQACKRSIDLGNKGHISDKATHQVMEALLRLRMFCNNGRDTRIEGSVLHGGRPDEILSVLQQSGEAMCVICSVDVLCVGSLKETGSGYLLPCLHLVCGECTSESSSLPETNEPAVRCPLCPETHILPSLAHFGAKNPQLDTTYPVKVVSLLDDVKRHYLDAKCIVFSFWKLSLDVVGRALTDAQVSYLRVDGDMTTKQRNYALGQFQLKSKWRVLIMTFSTGAAGLNGLTVANRVHILEPQWNPAVEKQAIGRVIRLNQEREVTVIKYVVKSTIEEMIEQRQLRKLQIAGSGFLNRDERHELHASQWQQLQDHFEANEDME